MSTPKILPTEAMTYSGPEYITGHRDSGSEYNRRPKTDTMQETLVSIATLAILSEHLHVTQSFDFTNYFIKLNLEICLILNIISTCVFEVNLLEYLNIVVLFY